MYELRKVGSREEGDCCWRLGLFDPEEREKKVHDLLLGCGIDVTITSIDGKKQVTHSVSQNLALEGSGPEALQIYIARV